MVGQLDFKQDSITNVFVYDRKSISALTCKAETQFIIETMKTKADSITGQELSKNLYHL